MISPAFALGAPLFLILLCTTVAMRLRDRRARRLTFIAAICLFAAMCSAAGYIQAALLTQSRPAAELWLSTGALSLIAAGVLVFRAWRRSSGSP